VRNGHQQDGRTDARAIVAHSAAAISFSSADQSRFVSISGAAAIVKQKGVEGAQPSHTLCDPRPVLIRLDVHHAECWNAGTARMVTLFSQARAIPAIASPGRVASFVRAPHPH